MSSGGTFLTLRDELVVVPMTPVAVPASKWVVQRFSVESNGAARPDHLVTPSLVSTESGEGQTWSMGQWTPSVVRVERCGLLGREAAMVIELGCRDVGMPNVVLDAFEGASVL